MWRNLPSKQNLIPTISRIKLIHLKCFSNYWTFGIMFRSQPQMPVDNFREGNFARVTPAYCIPVGFNALFVYTSASSALDDPEYSACNNDIITWKCWNYYGVVSDGSSYKYPPTTGMTFTQITTELNRRQGGNGRTYVQCTRIELEHIVQAYLHQYETESWLGYLKYKSFLFKTIMHGYNANYYYAITGSHISQYFLW